MRLLVSRFHLGAVGAFKGQEQGRGVFGAHPNVAFVALALDEIHAPAIEALVPRRRFRHRRP